MNYHKQVHPVDVHLSKKLRKLRQSRNYTQEKFASLIGIKYQNLQHIEWGNRHFRVSFLLEICKKFDVPLSYFLEGVEDLS